MPELPEVETVKRGLERTIVGKTVQSVDVRVPKIFVDERSRITQVLIGQRVVGVERRAKLLLMRLANDWTLAIHLKMTGQIIVIGVGDKHSFVGGHPEKAYEQVLPHKHTHVVITLSDGVVLYFNDLRKFGWLRLFPQGNSETSKDTSEAQSEKLITLQEFLASLNLGPEPLEDGFTLHYFRTVLKQRKTLIKSLLLNQSFIAGIGNIYADEALFAAAIQPRRRAHTVTKAEANRLHEAIKQVLELGITHGGTSFNSYRTVAGTPGGMRQHLKVYGREGQPCPRCGELIVRKKLGQRSTHFCPHCQQ